MEQSTSHKSFSYGLHVAIIMDGNGRWATRQGLPRVAGHRAGVEAVGRTIDAALGLGIGTLTLFAFTAGNWERPPSEVAALMQLFRDFFCEQKNRLESLGIRVSIIGRRDRLVEDLRRAVEEIEAATAHAQAMHLRFAVDYSARDAILHAARRLDNAENVSREEFTQILAEVNHAGGAVPDVDLLIRTGGEQRLSDCMLWESAYAELVFSQRMWPDFDAADFHTALQEFHSRHRSFGRVPEGDSKEAMIGGHGEHPEGVVLKTA
jgi:undecaprenyl diphosphate synthase